MSNFHLDWTTWDLHVVLVTGALGGIGRAVCSLYNDRGYYVIGIDRYAERDNGFIELHEGHPKPGGQFQPLSNFIGDEYHRMDFSEMSAYFNEDVEEFFSRLEEDKWKFCVVVHCAAYQYCDPMANLRSHELGEFDKTMEINVGSVYHLNQALYPWLKRDHGSIVVVGSVHSVVSSANISLYAMSKCALVGLVRNTCIEWAKDGIRINMVSPGAVDTPMLRAGLSRTGGNIESNFDRLASRHLNGRVGTPDEVARVIFFLGSKQSSLINGQNIIADGGVSCVLSTEVG